MVETPVGSVNETLYFEMNRNEHGATDNFDMEAAIPLRSSSKSGGPPESCKLRRVKANQMPKAVEPNQ